MKITKNTDYSKNNYAGYGLCFDEGGTFTHTIREGNFDHTAAARIVLIFGVDMSFSVHATNSANNIYVMGEALVQRINILQYTQRKTFIETLQTQAKSSY